MIAAKPSQPKSTNITKVIYKVTREQREERLGQRGATIWFTGLSGSGKSHGRRDR
jgi:adenylylsulfate kinase